MANRRPTPKQREELGGYILSTRDNFEQYHARKENMAWVATTVYLGALLALSNLVADNNQPIFPSLLFKWGLIIVVVITCSVTLAFIKKQSDDRTIAAHVVASCGEVLAQLVDPEFELTQQSLHVCEYQELGYTYLYPKILIERLRSPNRQSQRILWNYWSPYVAVIIWTVASAVFVLVR